MVVAVEPEVADYQGLEHHLQILSVRPLSEAVGECLDLGRRERSGDGVHRLVAFGHLGVEDQRVQDHLLGLEKAERKAHVVYEELLKVLHLLCLVPFVLLASVDLLEQGL